MQFSFKYCIHAEVHTTDDWMLEQEACSMVYWNRQDMHSDSSNRMMPLAGSGLKMKEDFKIVAALLICNANTLISYFGNV